MTLEAWTDDTGNQEALPQPQTVNLALTVSDLKQSASQEAALVEFKDLKFGSEIKNFARQH